MMKHHPPRAIFGLNFLSTPPEDGKDDESLRQGAYDSEQQVWITQGQVLAKSLTLYYTVVSANVVRKTPDYGYAPD